MKNIIIVDDNEDNRDQFLKMLEDTQHSAVAVENITEATGPCEILLIDISSVCPPRKSPMSMLYTSNAYQPICAFLEYRPGCTVIIHTGLSRHTAQGIADDIKERSPDTVVKVADIMDWSETLRMIEES